MPPILSVSALAAQAGYRDDDAGAPLGAPEAIVQQANSESPH
jgi:hypothetical protein